MLNLAPALELDDELLSKVDICLPNEVEAAALTHMSVDHLEGAIKAARALLSRGWELSS